MKCKFLSVILLIPLFANAQIPNFSISGKIAFLHQPAMIYLDYMDNNISHEDSALLVNNAFRFSGHIAGISPARLSLAHNREGKNQAVYQGADNIYLYFAGENMTITSGDSLINATITGSKVYDQYAALNKAIGGSIMEIDRAANNEFKSGTAEKRKDSLFFKAVDARFRKKIAARTIKQVQFAEDHPDSYFGLVALSEAAGARLNVARIKPLYLAFDEKLRETSLGKDLGQRIAAAQTIGIGDPAPSFIVNDVSGRPVSLAGLKGKIVLIDFWASWCEPCRAESPNLKTQYKLYRDKGFEIISISVDKDRKSWLKAISDDGLPWLQVCDLQGMNGDAVKSYAIGAVPTFFLVGRDGKIIANADIQGAPLNKRLAEMFRN